MIRESEDVYMNTFIKPPCCNPHLNKQASLVILTPDLPNEVETWYIGKDATLLRDAYVSGYFHALRDEASEDRGLLDGLSERKMFAYSFSTNTPTEVINFFTYARQYNNLHFADNNYKQANALLNTYASLVATYVYSDYCDVPEQYY